MIRKILFIALKNSYGKKELGEALNKRAHSNMLKELVYRVENLWLDDYDNNDKLQNELIKLASKFNPDLIFFKLFKFEIYFDTLEKLKDNYF